MIRFFRQLRKFVLFGAVTCGAWMVLVATVPFAGLFGYNPAQWRARALSAWARRIVPVLGMRMTVEGPVPAAPFVLVTNHLGYIDIVVLAAQAPIAFVAKAEIARWPLIGRFARAAGTVFIDRARVRDIPRVVGAIEASFAGGIGVAIFPEATSSAGSEVLRFRPSLLEAAARARLPVVYAALTYRTPPDEPPAHFSVCWWGDMGFPGHVAKLFALRSFEARLRFGSERVIEADRKLLAERLHRKVSELFERVVEDQAHSPGLPVS